MLSFTAKNIVALSALVGSVYAQGSNNTATPLALATVQAQFQGAHIVPDVIPSFSPEALLQPTFTGGLAGVGQAISKDGVATKPTINIVGLPASTTPTKYTIMMVDGNYIGSNNTGGLNLHYLQNNVVIGADGGANNGTSPATIPYAGPAPAAGTGPHRYTILLYQQPADFTAPSTPAANSGVHLFNVSAYTTAAKLQGPEAGTYFTVEVGTATVTVGSTSAVNPATLSVPASTGSGSPSGSGKTPASTTSAKSGADKLVVSTIGGSIMGLIGAAVLLM